MRLCLRIVSLLFVVTGTLTQDGFDLSDALGDDEVLPTPAKPKEEPKAPEDPKSGGGLDLFDALAPDEPKPTPKPPKKPSSGDAGGGDGFDLGDALGPDPNPKPDKPVVNPPPSGGGGGGTFDINDLADAAGDGYKPDESPGGGGRSNPGYESNDGAEEPQAAGSGKIAGIASAIGVALLGAATSYFAYQKKKLCFKIQGGVDPESAKGQHGNQSDPQVFSNLLRTS